MIILHDEEYEVTIFGDTLEEVVCDYEDNHGHQNISELHFYKAERVEVARKLEFI